MWCKSHRDVHWPLPLCSKMFASGGDVFPQWLPSLQELATTNSFTITITWKCCSGPGVRAVPGVQIRVQFPLRMVTWKEVLQWARSEGCHRSSDTCLAAAKNGCCSGPKRYTKKRVFKTLSWFPLWSSLILLLFTSNSLCARPWFCVSSSLILCGVY